MQPQQQPPDSNAVIILRKTDDAETSIDSQASELKERRPHTRMTSNMIN